MTYLINDSADFADEALTGMVAAHREHLRTVHGGVARATRTAPGEVALVVGGGSGHYPAFAGWVGPGFAHGAACGNIFASPSASQVYSVCKAAHVGGGILLGFGNYAGDVLHFGQAAERLRSEGIDVRVVPVTDDIASGPADDPSIRRGIAGDLLVYKVAGAAAASGLGLDDVERVTRLANERTRSLGFAFSGCSLPGAAEPLFSVPVGQMSLGLGIHGEPGISEAPIGTADEIARKLVAQVLAEAPEGADRVAVLFNGLGTVKYEELFVAYGTVASELERAGLTIVDPVVGEQVTSLDMAGVSLTVLWLTPELEQFWAAPCDTPAFRRGAMVDRAADTERLAEEELADDAGPLAAVPPASPQSRRAATRIAAALAAVHQMLVENEAYLGQIDAVAGDGDHGIGMVRGARAADDAARTALADGAGARTLLSRAADAWAERAGGTSGALWGAALSAVAGKLSDEERADPSLIPTAVRAGVDAIASLGGAEVGDKTMIDAAVPFRDSFPTQAPSAEEWRSAVTVAMRAAEGTAEFRARRGRSRTHAEASIGTPDPGAISFSLIVDTLTAHITEQKEQP
ncbi:dihydroxyacetone kinase family protein [Enemella evansiae]|uniref:dihydroxyacetone kinase family protein n=1 Tax=Enemella evansiae TaxID=2016499 RepID=UPI000B95CE47|nr:dihydroxyacetone kinase family protein [Enemella evansiae]OYN96943.1 D-erythrulose kinase [Enemella evansiae]OYO06215.1 D-erythrulose kinase [Enemella evansiae]OYO11903.1 D-erythrulose kinase [Enemella evansiae]PFG68947.1 dihydroxyacetone kinase [Propionibacteriaceae bacterium ES.041]